MNCDHYRKTPPRRRFVRDSVEALEEIGAVDIRPHPRRPGRWIGYDRLAGPVGRPKEKLAAAPVLTTSNAAPPPPITPRRAAARQPDPSWATPIPQEARTWWIVLITLSGDHAEAIAFETEEEARRYDLAPGDPPRHVLRTVLLREPPITRGDLRVLPQPSRVLW